MGPRQELNFSVLFTAIIKIKDVSETTVFDERLAPQFDFRGNPSEKASPSDPPEGQIEACLTREPVF